MDLFLLIKRVSEIGCRRY